MNKYLSIILLFFISCTSNSTKENLKTKQTIIYEDSVDMLMNEIMSKKKVSEKAIEIDAEDKKDIKILMYGDDPRDEYKNLEWYGIFVKNDLSEIRKVKIDIEKYYHPIFDSDLEEDSEDVTGRKLIVEGKEKPFFLISGLKGIKERKIPSVKIKGKKIPDKYKDHADVMAFIEPNKELIIEYNNNSIRFFAEGNPDNFKSENIELDEPYKLYVSSSKVEKQLIEKVDNFELITLIYGFVWFGDLDNDGQTDVLMSVPTLYVGRSYSLYLSSYAKDNEVFNKVAQYGFIID